MLVFWVFLLVLLKALIKHFAKKNSFQRLISVLSYYTKITIIKITSFFAILEVIFTQLLIFVVPT